MSSWKRELSEARTKISMFTHRMINFFDDAAAAAASSTSPSLVDSPRSTAASQQHTLLRARPEGVTCRGRTSGFGTARAALAYRSTEPSEARLRRQVRAERRGGGVMPEEEERRGRCDHGVTGCRKEFA